MSKEVLNKKKKKKILLLLIIIYNKIILGVIGKLCNVNSDCEVEDENYEELGLNAMVECSSQKLCACKKGFVSENLMVCRAYLNSFCITDVNCVTTNAICNTDTNKCKCRRGYKDHGNNRCARKRNYGFY